MKLWILRFINRHSCTYGGALGYVIQANTEEEARAFASVDDVDSLYDPPNKKWLDEKSTMCDELGISGEARIILGSYSSDY